MIRRNSIIGCAIVLLLVNTAVRAEFVRVALVSPSGNAQGARQAIQSGDVIGTYTNLSETTFNALSPAQLRGNYDVMLFAFDAGSILNADFSTRIGPYLSLGGGVIFENPTNLPEIAAVTGGMGSSGSGGIVTATVPGLTDGISNNFVNYHFVVSGWAGWLSQFLGDGSNPTGLYGTYAGGGRMVITGQDNDYHAIRGGGGPEGNQYNLIVNELRWVTGLQQVPDPISHWSVNGLGSWTVATNWNPAQAPNTNQHTAVFGSVITAPRTVVVDAAVTVKAIEFNNVNSYAIAGTGSVNLEADTGNAAITVDQGTHEFQARVNLLDDTDADVSGGATLEFNNRLSLGGYTLTKDGGGALRINNALNMSGGAIVVLGGTVGGGGTIGGNLVNSAGTVTPGISPGILAVSGDYTQNSSSTLAIELGGTKLGSQHDQLDVSGTATLGGTLAVSLINSFTPTFGQTFEILSASSVSGTFVSESFPSLAGNLAWRVMYSASNVSLAVVLRGDFNFDGIVDAADYVVWRKGVGVAPTQDNYNLWRANFGQTAGSSSGASANANVPEPTTLVMLIMAAAASIPLRRRRIS